MARTYQRGAAVKSGTYVDLEGWAVHAVARDGERLPAGRGAWRRVPTPVAVGLTPVLGLAFLIFLPVIGFALVARAAAKGIARLFHASATDLAATVSPGWAPGEAHLTGKRGEGEGAEEDWLQAAAGRLDALEREIALRRMG
ncbi:MAG TPA: hypothetical protein VLS93_04670 [Anaeromyxobacteraceae bacterium]|nr:hypothetical protein [Anaeromyxobacteraceae bacterium]